MEDHKRVRGPSASSYSKLIEFFESVIANPHASMRVRITAAGRLDDLLRRQERRETSEVRRAEREAARAARERAEALERETQPTPEELGSREAEQQRELAAERALTNLVKIMQKSL